MDIGKIKIDMLNFRKDLKQRSISPDVIILFGSRAHGRERADSDIDIAIVSRDLGKNRLQESSELNLMASRINPLYEVIPVSLESYLDPNAASPILEEIKKNGLVLF
jgi:uncharacterized protein